MDRLTPPVVFGQWWRRLYNGSDAEFDNTHLMRMAGRFSRRVRAYAKAHHIPIIDCSQGERKHQIAEEYLAQNPAVRGVFLILVARALAPVWDVQRAAQGTIRNVTSQRVYVNQYSFHIWDPQCGHSTIKLSGHPPFPAQILLNGHEFLACQAKKTGLESYKEGNYFTHVAQPADLERVADTLSDPGTIGRLIQVCDGWIYTCYLCFVLDSAEQERTGFRYTSSVYQVDIAKTCSSPAVARWTRSFRASSTGLGSNWTSAI